MSAFSTSPADVEARLKELNQERLLQHLHELGDAGRRELMGQLCSLDWKAIVPLLQTVKADAPVPAHEALSPVVPYVFSAAGAKEWAEGEAFIKAQKLALFTVAGGSGSRLGYEGPKGCFGVTPVRGASLFQVFAEKILYAQKKYGVTFPWVLMTSPQNDKETKAFFEKNNFFGLKKEQMFFFEQGEMPAVDAQTGDLLLESAHGLALSPDGHGGSFKGLQASGALEWMAKQGSEIISYFQVDNPLVKPVDPLFVGAHILSGSEFSSKATPKKNAEEKVGVFGLRNGSLGVIEYTDMPPELSKSVDDKGELRFRWGNTAIHLLNVNLIKKVVAAGTLPYHAALKKVPYWNGQPVSPQTPNARKFEQFVFDAIPLASHPIVVGIRFEEEFYPVKNATGVDSPETSKQGQLKLWASWLKAAGVEVPVDATGLPTVKFEISPLFAQSADDVKTQKAAGKVPAQITDGLVLK